ncbi:methyltransferase domain-containing protein [Candidatus Woesearchaeota archaeon]|nr:methyltransferase domain-containing protein [Candidatus Woesearchaeota archaeon]
MALPDILTRTLRQIAPRKAKKHYIDPWRFLIPLVKGQVSTDYQRFWQKYYADLPSPSDKDTIKPGEEPQSAAYHYTAVKLSILQSLNLNPDLYPKRPSVLDIGTGTGHWIDFYLGEVFNASRVTGVEIAPSAAEFLREKYSSRSDVTIMEADISKPGFSLEDKVGIVNAIGVMFHIVPDEGWKRAIANIANALDYNGVILVGGQFRRIPPPLGGLVQFEKIPPGMNDEVKYVATKRLRSLGYWKKILGEHGLEVVDMIKTKAHPLISTPENNILVARHSRSKF